MSDGDAHDGSDGDSGASDEFLRAVARAPKVDLGVAGDDPLVGATLGRYRVTGPLGRGGMGVVYRANDTTLRREVAIKVLPEELVADRKRRQRFLREARLTAAITHANIATVYDVGEDGERVYIAMELVSGRTLRDAAKEGPLPLSELLRVALGVARGLAKAHDARIVHRDIKPDNVMLAGDDEVKILDFGLAKSFGDEQPPESGISTEPGRVLGSAPYMSPEQAKGRAVDGQSDVFSFGVMLYELAAGERPYRAKGLSEILVAHRTQPPEPLARKRADLPRALGELVDACMRAEPSERPTAGAIVEQLRALAARAATAGGSIRAWLVGGGLLLAVVVGAAALRLSHCQP